MKFNFCNFSSLKKIISNCCAYMIAFSLFVTTAGAWIWDPVLDLKQEQLFWWLLSFVIITSLILFLMNLERNVKMPTVSKKKIVLFVICSITYIYKFQGDFEWYYAFFFLMIVWFMFFLYESDDSSIIWHAFVNVTTIYAVLSLFFYFGGTLLNIIPASGRTSLNWGSWTQNIRTFHNIYYESQKLIVNDTISIPRNCGLFPEGPMYNFVLCIAAASEMFLSTRVHWWKVAILIVASFTTFSTTTYLFFITAVIFYLGNIIFKSKGNSIHKIAFLLISLFGGILTFGILLQKATTSSGAGSMNVRFDHLSACIKTWLTSPVIGVGFQNQEAILEFAQYKQGMSMGLVYFIACGGILMTSLLLIPYIMSAVYAYKGRIYNEFIFETLFLVLYFITAVSTYPILRFFIAYILICEYKGNTSIQRVDPFGEKLDDFFQIRNCNIQKYYTLISKNKIYIGVLSVVVCILTCVILGITAEKSTLLFILYGGLSFTASILLALIYLYIQLIVKTKDNTSNNFRKL